MGLFAFPRDGADPAENLDSARRNLIIYLEHLNNHPDTSLLYLIRSAIVQIEDAQAQIESKNS
jgi:hypothetical protein